MTFVFIGIGAVSFIAIAARFAARATSKEPAASRVK
ncbi:MAG: hypothetical protein BWX71_00618 [Deltaproteobacteria bacterium ADurb.Bin072]|jgi:hypothetical protein|nr:MAG: hypothetical protein BWX71_00618 [Deltaproteobacteria bacterium ADurb.Bin072]